MTRSHGQYAGVILGIFAGGALLLAQTPARPPAQPARPAPRPAPPAARPPAPAPAAPKPATPPPPPPQDITAVSTYTTGDKTATSTIQIRSSRQRIDLGNDLVTLLECDANQTAQLNTKTKTYLSAPFEDAHVTLPPAPAGSKGGQITYTTTITDTGEKKDIFGIPARHLLTVVTKDASPTACDKKPEKIETDGWYADLPPALSCVAAPQADARIQIDPRNSGCRDEVHFARAGAAGGYPLSYTMTATAGTDAPAVTKLEVTSLQRSTLPADLFAVPADYLEVKNNLQLMADHRPGEIVPKKPGIVRIGVAQIANKTDASFDQSVMTGALTETLSDSEYDIVPIVGDTPAARLADAKDKDCDFVLENTVTDLKKPSGGLLGKLQNTSGDEITAKVSYTLSAPGQPKPVMSSSESSSTSAFSSAVGAAKHVASFVAPFILVQYKFMSTFSQMKGGASAAALGQTSDPVLSSVLKLIDKVPSKAAEHYSSGESAVAAALEKETQSVFSELQKRKK